MLKRLICTCYPFFEHENTKITITSLQLSAKANIIYVYIFKKGMLSKNAFWFQQINSLIICVGKIKQWSPFVMLRPRQSPEKYNFQLDFILLSSYTTENINYTKKIYNNRPECFIFIRDSVFRTMFFYVPATFGHFKQLRPQTQVGSYSAIIELCIIDGSK